MISRRIFARKQNLDKILMKYSDIISVQSEVMDDVVYGIADCKFAIIIPEGAVFCPVHEAPILAGKLISGLREEAMSVFEEWGKQYDTGRTIL